MRTFQRTINSMAFEPLLARILAPTPWSDLARIAQWIAADDPYQESTAIAQALAVLGTNSSVGAHLEHQLWCAWREAAWTSGRVQPLSLRVSGEHWLAETE